MRKITKQEVMDIAKQLHFTFSETELESLLADFDVYFKQLAVFDAIDTQDVEPLVYPFETPVHHLRPDSGTHVLERDALLSNAPKTKDNFVIVPKVVK